MNSKKSFYRPIRIITMIMLVLVACVLLLFGAGNLIHPDVSETYLNQNTRICLMMIITGLFAVYSVFRPLSGGILLCVCVVGLTLVFRGFLRNPVTPFVLIAGALSVLSGYLQQQEIKRNK